MVGMMAEGKTRNEIAKATGRSAGLVTKVAAQEGHDFLASCDEMTKSRLARAHKARSSYSQERRAEHAAVAQDKVGVILDLMGERQEVAVHGKDGFEVVSIKPDARAWKDWAQAVNLLQRTVLDVKRADDQGDGDQGARSLLQQLVEGLAEAAA